MNKKGLERREGKGRGERSKGDGNERRRKQATKEMKGSRDRDDKTRKEDE